MKLAKIAIANIVILVATFIGYRYLPDILNLELHGSGKLIAVIAMVPAIALVSTIQIGLRQQRIFATGANGIRFGDSVSGVQSYSWEDISSFNLSPDTKVLHFASGCMGITETIPLKKFGINELQYSRLHELSSALIRK
ncbi:hypothetical protein [Alishewanella sp. HL-SH06]|uniref:hypothetical protein n=1 Tax=Alishewanella sp. HL-SH06 TaxID=3461144 RepID=UPI0040412724